MNKMSDYVVEGNGWSGRMMAPVTLLSARDTAATSTTTWRLPHDHRVVPRPSFRATRSASMVSRSAGSAPRRHRSAVVTPWATLDPLSGNSDGGEGRAVEPPLVTVHVNNQSCAASGSEAFFNLREHAGRRGISRSSSCVSALSRGSYKLHSLSPPTPTTHGTTHAGVSRRPSMNGGVRQLGRSFSVAPADLGGYGGTRVVGRRAQRQRSHLPIYTHQPKSNSQQQQQQQQHYHQYHQTTTNNQQHHYHYNIMQQQPEKIHKKFGQMDLGGDVLNAEKGNGVLIPPPLHPRPPSPNSVPRKWRPGGGDGNGCRCGCCSLGTLVARAYKAVLKAASTCMFHKYMGEFDLMTANGHPTPSPTPPNGPQTDMMPVTPSVVRQIPRRQRKVVVALYDYNAADHPGDLSLRKNDELEVMEDAQEHWWKMRNLQTGQEGYAPSNYVRERDSMGLMQYDWYLGDATRQRAEVYLMQQEREGSFVVRNSTTNSGIYTLSVFSRQSHPQVKHYHIKRDQEGNYYLSHNIKCQNIPDLIYRHQLNPGGLCARLRPPAHGRDPPTTAGLSRDKWEIDPSELNLLEELGSGQFGVVRHGKLRCLDVAVKMMKEGTMSEDEFIEEAKVMKNLRHANLVQLYGVCSRHRPIYIVTEYLRHGSLLHYLRSKERNLLNNVDVLLDMCMQVCEGMAYLEQQRFIHRDLAARNCLVGDGNLIKVGDFGLARYVVDDEYTGSGGAKFPIKWAAPEVLNFMRFSSKSDVWAYGVLMWEVFACGKMPYGRMKNAEVVEMVQQGRVLDKPRFCPDSVYSIMRRCWENSAEMRPSFSEIARSLQDQ